jgi:hypothetical protein
MKATSLGVSFVSGPRRPKLAISRPLEKVQIVILPTDDSSTIPAYLHWGHWNGCPAPEYHIAALRSWRERFGAELVGLSHDVMNVRVQSRPPTREAALELAREQYVYCSDIVDQGVQTLSALAAVLMESDLVVLLVGLNSRKRGKLSSARR